MKIPPTTLFVGHEHYHLERIESTNAYALSLASKSNPSDGTAISTFNQTAGRGQIGNSWQNVSGKDLAVSYIFYPKFLSLHEQFYMNLAVSLSVCSLIQSVLPDHPVCIKWPNDILVNEKKVSGILIQNSIQKQNIQYSVAGTGINVNSSEFSAFPRASSLYLESGKSFDLHTLLQKAFAQIEHWYMLLKGRNFSTLSAAYYSKLYRYQHETLFVTSENKELFGKIVEVSKEGKLVISCKNELHHFGIKEIAFADHLDV